ncbi:hypothetical protein EWF95_00790 [Halonotius roseus]|uniref:Uncharacterized protein n=1 Tax=Halonotius roseus TaxID=2511997 RepID=A0A544QSP7_9EURY|nr:hypothetical protein EWF95_00790 [Halonotius roseus]
MDEATRESLLERVNRQSATVGAKTLETITINGTEIDLHELLIETRELPEIPPGTKDLVSTAKRTLKTEREARVERLKTEGSLSEATAETLAEEIIGLDRARNALDGVYRPDYGEEAHNMSIDDYKRWLGFVESIQ